MYFFGASFMPVGQPSLSTTQTGFLNAYSTQSVKTAGCRISSCQAGLSLFVPRAGLLKMSYWNRIRQNSVINHELLLILVHPTPLHLCPREGDFRWNTRFAAIELN